VQRPRDGMVPDRLEEWRQQCGERREAASEVQLNSVQQTILTVQCLIVHKIKLRWAGMGSCTVSEVTCRMRSYPKNGKLL